MILILLLITIIILLICLNKNIGDDTTAETYGGRVYKVRKTDALTQTSTAQKLDYFRNELQKLVTYCYTNNLPTAEDASRLYSRFKNLKINETATGEPSAAYVVNKAQELRICLQNEDENDTMFVLLHELAHVMSKSYGHNAEFKKNMDVLVKLAVKLNIYKPVDYTKEPVNYCGVTISSTPCHNNNCLVGQKF
jgi:hypothetical protein